MILTTERLLLRDFVESDWEAVLAYQQDPLYLRYNEWTSRTAEEVRQFTQMFLDHQKQIPRIKYQFAVTLKSTGQLIGNCGVRAGSQILETWICHRSRSYCDALWVLAYGFTTYFSLVCGR
jgi:RimJ/RimL family protein N-acetyltransferase